MCIRDSGNALRRCVRAEFPRHLVRVAGIVSRNVESRRAARRNTGRRHRAGTLQVLERQRHAQGGDRQIVVAIASAVCASRSGHINEQDAVPCREVVPESCLLYTSRCV